MDKTGTVTTGTMTLLDVITADGEQPDDVLRLAGALEDSSEHPIAKAIASGARNKVGDLPSVEEFTDVAGLVVQGVVEGHAVVAVGSASSPTRHCACPRSSLSPCRKPNLRADCSRRWLGWAGPQNVVAPMG